jgi:hypothetical protein
MAAVETGARLQPDDEAPATRSGRHLDLPLGPPGPARSRWEWAAWLGVGALLAVVLTWPLLRDLTTVVPQDTGDPLGQAWFLSWPGQALLASPLGLFTGAVFEGNTFYPAEPSAAFSDSLLGYFPAALVGDGVTAAVVRYDLVFLFAYALAFAAAALLARELGCRPAAAAVAGAAFAWAPWRMTHNGHLNVLSTGGVALTVFLLVSGYRRGRPWQVVAGWAAAAWQISLGFALGIWFAYFLAALAALSAATWLRLGRPALPGPLVRATAVGGALFLVVTALMVRPYLRILAQDPDATRGREEVVFYSPPLRSLLAAPGESRVWGQATAFARDTLPWAPEQALFPGLLAVVLAIIGLRWRGATPGLRIGLFVGTALLVLLSLGFSLLGGALYAPLFDYAPGWSGLRTPGRLAFLWSLGLALLAAFGAQRVVDATRTALQRARRPERACRALAAAVGVALAALVAYEGSPRLPLVAVPQPPAALADAVGPRLHLPSDSLHDTAYMLWSTAGYPQIANGSASYTPATLEQLRAATAGFPDAASVQVLRDVGIRTVVVHRDRLPGTPWDGAADRPVDGLGISRDVRGEVVLFDLTR